MARRVPAHRVFKTTAALLVLCGLAIWPMDGRGAFTSYADVRDILAALSDIVPPELHAGGPAELDVAWTAWVVRHDRDIRNRLERGDEDTIVNWLLFGTSFTARPRALLDVAASPPDAPAAADSADPGQLSQLIIARTRDLVAALATPRNDERRLFARRLLSRNGYLFDTPAARARAETHLVAEVVRVVREQQGFAKELEAARRPGDATQEFATRSKLFRNRGLSLDTSILSSFAIERALDRLKSEGLLAPRSVRQVAIIGPGLDFSDKSTGYDFYPQQTLQPFALIDSLVRLGLDDPARGVHLTTLDISPRVNDHMTRVHEGAKNGSPYVVRVALDSSVPWKPEVAAYWKRIGDRIGTDAREPKPPAAGNNVGIRTIRVRSSVALQVTSEDLNVVAQRLVGASFDLVVATNVFVYYDVLDQCLGLANVEAMIRPGGLLLSNNALLELPSSRLRSAGYLTVPYSDRIDDGDHIVWYRRAPD